MMAQGGWKRWGRFYPLSESYELPLGKYWREYYSDWPYERFDLMKSSADKLGLGRVFELDPANWRGDDYNDDKPGKAWRGLTTALSCGNPSKFSGQRIYTIALCGHEINAWVSGAGSEGKTSKRLVASRIKHLSARKCNYCIIDEFIEEQKIETDPVYRILKAMKGEL